MEKDKNRKSCDSTRLYANILFYCCFGWIYFRMFYWTTLFPNTSLDQKWFEYVYLLTVAGMGSLAIWTIVTKNDWLFRIGAMVLITVGVGYRISSGTTIVLVTFLVVIAATGRDIRKMMLIALIIGSCMMVISYLASVHGYLPYLIYENGGILKYSYSFGMIYRTDLGAHVQYLIMIYALMRGVQIYLWEYLLLWFSGWTVWHYAYAKLNTVCIALFLTFYGVILLIHMLREKYGKPNGEKKTSILVWTAAVHIVCMLLSFAYIYIPIVKEKLQSISIFDTIVNRIRYSREGFAQYSIKLFGNNIKERGAGGFVQEDAPYFFLDVVYVRLLLIYGLVITLIYLMLMTIASYRAAKRRNLPMVLALAIVAIAGMVEHHNIEMAYNVLILAATADVNPHNKQKKMKLSYTLGKMKVPIKIGINIASFVLLILVITYASRLDKILLLEEQHPGYFYNILLASNSYIEDGIRSYIVTRVNKDGFGEVTPRELEFYLKCSANSYPNLDRISLIFDDDTGIEIKNNQARYGAITEKGEVEVDAVPINLEESLIVQIPEITYLNRKYDDNGNIIYQFRTDAQGNGVVDQYGVAGIRREYQNFSASLLKRDNKMISEQYLGVDGRPVICIDHRCSLITYKYSEDGMTYMTRCYDQTGKQLDMGSVYFHEFLQSLKGKDFVVSINDEGTVSLSEPLLQDLRELGITSDLKNKDRYSFYAISIDGTVIEDLSSERLNYCGMINGRMFDVTSSGFNTGSYSSIMIDNTEYSKNVRGMNFVVIDGDRIESISFDTFTPYMAVTR